MDLSMIVFMAVLAMGFGPELAGRPDLHRTFHWPVIFGCGLMAVFGFLSGSMFSMILWGFFGGFRYWQGQRYM